MQQRYAEEQEERERAVADIQDTQSRLGRAAGYGRADDGEGIGGRRALTTAQQAIRKEQRKRYQFDTTASDDEVEDELDDNLDEISRVTLRLKALGTSMGEELDRENERIGRITEKADGLDNRLLRNTQKVSYLACGVRDYC